MRIADSQKIEIDGVDLALTDVPGTGHGVGPSAVVEPASVTEHFAGGNAPIPSGEANPSQTARRSSGQGVVLPPMR
jgi:hypothetical protein